MRSAALPRFSSKIPGFISYVLLSYFPSWKGDLKRLQDAAQSIA